MRHYPAFLNLKGRRCLVVGAGQVGLRKLKALVTAEPEQILVLDTTEPGPEFADLIRGKAVVYECRPFAESDLAGCFLAVAATGSARANAEVAKACKKRGVLVNVVDDPEAGDFIVPAHFSDENVTVALSTAGQSPALARRMRRELQQWLGDRYGRLAAFMGALRPLVLDLGLETSENTTLFRNLVDSPLGDLLNAADRENAKKLLMTLLPRELRKHIGDLLHGCL